MVREFYCTKIFGKSPRLMLDIQAFSWGVKVEAWPEGDYGDLYSIEIKCRPTDQNTDAGNDKSVWPMADDMHPGLRGDPLAGLLRWVYEKFQFWWADNSYVANNTVKELVECLNLINRHAVACCDPVARQIAKKFAPNSRLNVYSIIQDDRTGRVGQLALTCPGALLFLIEFKQRSKIGAEATRKFISKIVEGEKLNRALDDLLISWPDAQIEWLSPCDQGRGLPIGPHIKAWDKMKSGPVEPLRNQRLFIRRAGFYVDPCDLLLCAPSPFVPEDIPKSQRANGLWYQAVSFASFEQEALELNFAYSRYLSRHGPELIRLIGLKGRFMMLGRLWDYIFDQKRILQTATSPRRVLADLDEWRNRPEFGFEGMRDDPRIKMIQEGKLAISFKPLEAPLDQREMQVKYLDNGIALCAEGMEMQHCLSSYLDRAIAGDGLYFSAVTEEGRLTIELERLGCSWYLGQVAGFANRTPTERESKLVDEWYRKSADCFPS